MFDSYKASGTRSRCDSETLPAPPPAPPPSRPRGASPRDFAIGQHIRSSLNTHTSRCSIGAIANSRGLS